MVTLPANNKTANYPPGPKSHPILGILPDYAADPLGFMSRSAKDYGDIVIWKGSIFSVYQLNHPDYIEEVLVKKTINLKNIKHSKYYKEFGEMDY
jgi:hypothetical protein